MTVHTRPWRACLALLSTLLAASALDAAPLERADLAAARELRQRALSSPLAYDLVRSLTTEVGPRFAGSPGDAAAVEWAVRNLERLGFSNVRRMDVTVPHWVRGRTEVSIVEPFPQKLVAVALGGSIGTEEGGLAAEVIQVRDLEELQALDDSAVAGRIVYFSQRMDRTRDASGYGRAVQVRARGPAAAAAKGAVAVVIRTIGTSNNRIAHTGATGYVDSVPPIPAVAISNPDADLLENQLASGRPVRLSLEITARELPPARSANVIAEIPGTDRSDEIVLLGAHLDSWDITPGALDDAAGVAIVTAAARLIADMEPKPRRTIRVVLFANEEFGLSGARTYAAQGSQEIARHVLAMEADLGAGPVWMIESRVAPETLPLVRQIHSVVEPLGVALGGNETSGGADIGPLRNLGVPVLSPQLDATNYFDVHHTVNDTLDKVNPEHLSQSVAVFAVAAYLAARADAPLPHLHPVDATR
ncbi:MAG: M20/M25/M40 family metallo-hydrolase [Pseudomonadota bacterium]|jgi:Predicted aminopeptidases|nr:MAG: peptidase M28 family protein [Pseudomonadota bacterium]